MNSVQLTEVPPGKIAAIVTSLEMFAAPPPRPEPPGLALTLARVEQPELAWYRDLFRRVGEDWLWFSRRAMSDDALFAILHDPKREVYLLRSGAAEAGLLELDFREPGVCELNYFGLAPASIGTGAGRWLINRAIELAWSRPISRFWVHTCTYIIRLRSRSICAPDSAPFAARSRFPTTRDFRACCRGARAHIFQSSNSATRS